MGVTAASSHVSGSGRPAVRYGVPLVLGLGALIGWWWSGRSAHDMGTSVMRDGMAGGSPMGLAAFLVAWLAMMTAMMLPAITPVVKLYARASTQGRVAPLPFFVGGYLAVWTVLGVPAYFAWRWLDVPLSDGAAWAGRLAGGVLVGAGLWQLTPLKDICLRHCRSPMSFFLRHGRRLEQPVGAARMGAFHGLFCLGCCWAMFAILVAIGTMNIGWMLALTALIVAEKTFPRGNRIALAAGVVFVTLGVLLVASPATIARMT